MTTDPNHPLAPSPTAPAPAPAMPVSTPPAPHKMRKPTPKVRAAIEALCTGQVKTITAAAKKVGLSREFLSRAFSEPHNRDALRTRAEREVVLSSGRAASRLRELIDHASGKVSLDATKFSLQCAGIGVTPAASVNVNLELRAGYVIDLRERGDRSPLPPIAIDGAGTVIDSKPVDAKAD